MDDLTLAAGFPLASREDWLKLVGRVLKGADVETLVGRTSDGIRIEPLYRKGDARPVIGRAHGPWRIAQRVDHPEREAANALALADLEGGAEALTLVFAGAPAARGFGLDVTSVDQLDEVLRGVMLDMVHVRFEAGSGGWDAADRLVTLAEGRGHSLSTLDLDLGIDPIGASASSGAFESWSDVSTRCARTLSHLRERGFQGRAFVADGRAYHEAGASEAQELAAVLATGVAYLRALEKGGHSVDAAGATLSFLLAADADEFLTTAKFRALRRLWARVEEACGLEPKPIRLHAETAWRMTTRHDPWVNMLRTTVAAFSAGVGGTDIITVLPFTAALGLADGFARRIARNTQLLLLAEANLWRVADPVAGAGAFEELTDALSERAWTLFQEIERERGIVASLESGAWQARIAAVRESRLRTVATRAEPITGTSVFPDLGEAPVSVLLPSPLRTAPSVNGTGEEAAHASGEADQAARSALPSIRLAEPFERLRDVADAQFARTGARPKIFLAELGTDAGSMARAGFAKNLFETGGLDVVRHKPFASAEALAAPFAASGAKIACVSASDGVDVHAAAQALHGAGARAVYVASEPGVRPHTSGEPPVTYVAPGCDVVALLGAALQEAAS